MFRCVFFVYFLGGGAPGARENIARAPRAPARGARASERHTINVHQSMQCNAQYTACSLVAVFVSSEQAPGEHSRCAWSAAAVAELRRGQLRKETVHHGRSEWEDKHGAKAVRGEDETDKVGLLPREGRRRCGAILTLLLQAAHVSLAGDARRARTHTPTHAHTRGDNTACKFSCNQ